MKNVSIQFAIFFVESLERPDLFANRINSRLNNIFDGMPQIIKLPDDIPVDIPMVQIPSTIEPMQFNVSKSRCDLIISPNLLSQTSLTKSVADCEPKLMDFLKAVFAENIAVNRVGIILTAFLEKETPEEYIAEKYLSLQTPLLKEASVRVNIGGNTNSFDINNIIEISGGTLVNEHLSLNESGVIFKRDINNVPVQDKLLDIKDVKAIWRHAATFFTSKKMGEIK